jgi:hypothetical protein
MKKILRFARRAHNTEVLSQHETLYQFKGYSYDKLKFKKNTIIVDFDDLYLNLVKVIRKIYIKNNYRNRIVTLSCGINFKDQVLNIVTSEYHGNKPPKDILKNEKLSIIFDDQIFELSLKNIDLNLTFSKEMACPDIRKLCHVIIEFYYEDWK